MQGIVGQLGNVRQALLTRPSQGFAVRGSDKKAKIPTHLSNLVTSDSNQLVSTDLKSARLR